MNIAKLHAHFGGEILTPASAGYDALWPSFAVGLGMHTSIRRITTLGRTLRPNAKRWKLSTNQPVQGNHLAGNEPPICWPGLMRS